MIQPEMYLRLTLSNEDRREKDPLSDGLGGFECKSANFERLYLRAPMDFGNVLGHL